MLAAALGGFGVWALYGSNWLLVERVSVSGTEVLTTEQVRAAAGVPVGTPLLSVDTSRGGTPAAGTAAADWTRSMSYGPGRTESV